MLITNVCSVFDEIFPSSTVIAVDIVECLARGGKNRAFSLEMMTGGIDDLEGRSNRSGFHGDFNHCVHCWVNRRRLF